MTLAIASMQAADLPSVLTIERAVFPTPWTAATLRACCSSGPWTAWVAKEGTGVVGYIIFVLVVDECNLLNIAVAPTARRRGVARQLMLRMLDDVRYRGAATVWLDVRASNQAAQRLYRSFGFVEVGHRKHYYQREREDGVVMTLQLTKG